MNKKFLYIFSKYIVPLFMFCALTALYYYIGQSLGINSDGVANILEARSIVNGNIILHGWTLPSDTFYTLDTQLDVILSILGINGLIIYHLTPAIIYSSILLLTYYIIKKISNSTIIAITSVVIFLGFPSGFYKSLVLFSPIHMLTILFVMAAFYLYNSNNIKWHTLYASILLYISVIGDPYAVFIGSIPIIIYSSVMLFHNINNNKKILNTYISMLYSSILSTAAAKTSVYIIHLFGGYHAVPNQMEFVSLENFSHNIYLLILSILEVTQSNFFGLHLFSIKTIIAVSRAFIVILTIVMIVKNSFGKDAVVDLTMISIITACLAFAFSTEPINIETSRYLLCLPVFMAIIFGARQSVISENNKLLYLTLISLFILMSFYGFVSAELSSRPASNLPLMRVINFLERKKLNWGIAGYWNAAPFTLLSDGKVQVRQVIVSDDTVVPMDWLSNSSWYKNVKHPQFVILGKENNAGLKNSVLEKNFGKYKKLKRIGQYSIIIY